MNRDLFENLFHNTIATGRSAREVHQKQKEPLGEISSQSRKRAASLDDSSNLSSNVKRRTTGGHMIPASMDSIKAQMEINRASREERQQMVINTQGKSQQLLTSQAIQVLEKDYDGRWLEDDMIKAIELFTDSNKAANVFLLLKAGDRRDRWLKTSLGIWIPLPAAVEKVNVAVTREKLPEKTTMVRRSPSWEVDFSGDAAEELS